MTSAILIALVGLIYLAVAIDLSLFQHNATGTASSGLGYAIAQIGLWHVTVHPDFMSKPREMYDLCIHPTDPPEAIDAAEEIAKASVEKPALLRMQSPRSAKKKADALCAEMAAKKARR
jgi:hypothetical protein